MNGYQVSLQEMLEAREKRKVIQDHFLNDFHVPLICFTMNIPGPVKTNDEIRSCYQSGKEELLKQLKKNQVHSLHQMELLQNTGDTFFLSADTAAENLKQITVNIEETHPAGRLFDMDVLDTDGKKLERGIQRKCIICGRPAQACARSRTHTVTELQDAVKEILNGLKTDAE